jgi:hypothetical protein
MTADQGYAPHTSRHMPAAISFNWLHIRRDLAAVDGLNAKTAILLTRAVGTMWAFWVFNGIALVSLPTAIRTGNLTVIINWVSSNWIQLILLPALLVGQRLQNVAAEQREASLAGHMDLVVDRLDTRTAGGLAEVLEAVRVLDQHVSSQDAVLQALAAPAKRLASPAERGRRTPPP